jgi:hypothetical protein
MATSNIVTTLSNALSALSPTQLLHLGSHLSEAGQMQALEVLDEMEMSDAAALSGQLAGIQGIPPAVMTEVGAAIKAATALPPNQAAFDTAITAAKVQLQQSAVSSSLLGGIL